MEITNVASFIQYYERIRSRTVRVIERIPEEKIEWTFKEGRFTFGDLIRHIASIERFLYAETVCGRKSAYPGHGRELADGYPNIIEYLNRLHIESIDLFRSLSDSDLQKKCSTPDGSQITIWKWMRALIEHEIHHRGQIYLYLSMIDVPTPPLYGLTSEEVKQFSRK